MFQSEQLTAVAVIKQKNKMKKIPIALSFIVGLLFESNLSCQADLGYSYSNPIAHSTITDLTTGLLVGIQGLVGWLAVIFIVIGGVIYLTAGGKDSQLTLAKNTIISALIGFSLAIAGPSLLREIKDILLGTTPAIDPIDSANKIYNILENVLSLVLTLVGILALMSLIYSGYSYLTSVGNKTKIDKAKKIALYSIIALVISGGALILVEKILTLLGYSV